MRQTATIWALIIVLFAALLGCSKAYAEDKPNPSPKIDVPEPSVSVTPEKLSLEGDKEPKKLTHTPKWAGGDSPDSVLEQSRKLGISVGRPQGLYWNESPTKAEVTAQTMKLYQVLHQEILDGTKEYAKGYTENAAPLIVDKAVQKAAAAMPAEKGGSGTTSRTTQRVVKDYQVSMTPAVRNSLLAILLVLLVLAILILLFTRRRRNDSGLADHVRKLDGDVNVLRQDVDAITRDVPTSVRENLRELDRAGQLSVFSFREVRDHAENAERAAERAQVSARTAGEAATRAEEARDAGLRHRDETVELGRQVQGQADEIGELLTTAREAAERLAVAQSDTITHLTERLDGVETAIADVGLRVDAAETAVTDASARAEGAETLASGLVAQVEANATGIAALNARADQIETDLEGASNEAIRLAEMFRGFSQKFAPATTAP